MKFTKNVIDACLDMFKSYPIIMDKESIDYTKLNKINAKETLACGFYIHPVVLRYSADFSDNEDEVLNLIKNKVGFDIFKLNNGLHKSFATVRDSSSSKLVFDQMVHYLTTYGFESTGIFDESMIYIPNEVLHLDEDAKPVFINIVNGITVSKIKDKVKNMITSGVALSPTNVIHIENLISDLKFNKIDLGILDNDLLNIKNKEIKVFLYDYLDIVPENPTEFLRFVIFKMTGKSLIIKDKALFCQIRDSEGINSVDSYFSKYDNLYGVKKLATIFYRYKMLWLAMKTRHNSGYINTIRRLAVKYHKPAKAKILDMITNPSFIADDEKIQSIKDELKNVTIFKKISILNAISYRMVNPTSFAYVVRNGRIYYKENDSTHTFTPNMLIFNMIKEDVIRSLAKNVKGKSFYIPSTVDYAMPTSEKLFIGGIPYNTRLSIGKNAIVGVSWDNINNKQTDLDLHMQNEERSFGWDTRYRDYDIYFSGDMTDATHGAAELFYIGESVKKDYFLVDFNFFNIDSFEDIDISKNGFDYKLVIDRAKDGIDKNNLVSSSSLACHVNCKSYKANNSIGLLDVDSDGNKSFVFMNYATGNEISATNKDETHLWNYVRLFSKRRMSFNSLIAEAGAKIYIEKESFYNAVKQEEQARIDNLLKVNPNASKHEINKIDISNDFVDLSLEALTVDTLLNFMK